MPECWKVKSFLAAFIWPGNERQALPIACNNYRRYGGFIIVTQASVNCALNKPSLDKFESAVVPGGMLFVNSSLIDRKCAG